MKRLLSTFLSKGGTRERKYNRTRQLNSLSRAVFSTAPALITPTFIHDDSIRQIHFLLDFIFQSVPRGALERVLDVAILLGARLEMRALVSARRAKGQGFFFRHHPRLASVLIRFVSQDDDGKFSASAGLACARNSSRQFSKF